MTVGALDVVSPPGAVTEHALGNGVGGAHQGGGSDGDQNDFSHRGGFYWLSGELLHADNRLSDAIHHALDVTHAEH